MHLNAIYRKKTHIICVHLTKKKRFLSLITVNNTLQGHHTKTAVKIYSAEIKIYTHTHAVFPHKMYKIFEYILIHAAVAQAKSCCSA